MKIKILSLLLLLTLVVLPLQSVQAKGILEDGKLIFGDNYTLKEGEVLDGDLVVFGGNVTIEDGATVNGSVVVFGGNINANGSISQEVVAFGGNIQLGETAIVNGDVVLYGGNLDADPKAQMKGETFTNVDAPAVPAIPAIPAIPGIPSVSTAPSVPSVVDFGGNPLFNALNVILRALAIGALAMLVSVFLQPQIDRVSQTVASQPLVAGGFGLLTVFIAPFAIVLLVITILLIPIAIIGVFILILAWLFGTIAMGQEVGERFTRAINKTWAPVLTTSFGTFMLVLVSGFLGMIPCFGGIIVALLGLMAIGASMMTWFRSRAPQIIPPASPMEVIAGS